MDGAWSETVELASNCELPKPVECCSMRHIKQGQEVKRSQFIKPNDNYAIAPYQALPVTGPVVAEFKGEHGGLPIVEPDHSISPEVKGC